MGHDVPPPKKTFPGTEAIAACDSFHDSSAFFPLQGWHFQEWLPAVSKRGGTLHHVLRLVQLCLLCQDGTPWALYAVAEDGQKLPQEEQCKDCFELWRRGFAYLDWQTLCKTNEECHEFSTAVSKARAVKNGQAKLEEDPQQVQRGSKVMLQVERAMVVLSERELRKLTKLPRLGKTLLRGIPSLNIVSENGEGEERVYAFRDDSNPFRRAKLLVQSEWSRTCTVMPESSVICSNQSEPWFAHLTKTQQCENGIQDLLDKDAAGHSGLTSVEEFLAKVMCKEQPAEEEEELKNPVAEASLKLIGVAAECDKVPGHSSSFARISAKEERRAETTPSSKARGHGSGSLMRTPSGVSVLSVDESAGGTPSVPVKVAGDAELEGSAGDETEFNVPPGDAGVC